MNATEFLKQLESYVIAIHLQKEFKGEGDVTSPEYQWVKNTTKAQCDKAIRLFERNFITSEEAVEMLLRNV